jgi:hypothetical protein
VSALIRNTKRLAMLALNISGDQALERDMGVSAPKR